ncbi:hypothetical protein EV1_005998 [Malus domestica]
MICWSLWGARNGKLWNDRTDPPDVCVNRATMWWYEFARTSVPGHGTRVQILSKWEAPPSRRLKMNIDGAWNGEQNVARFGAIVRDETGNFVSAKCGREKDVFSPLQAEAMTLRAGLSWAVDMGFQYIYFESDSLQIVEASCDFSLNLSFIGQIVEDIKVLLRSITEGKITHTHRQENSVAHHLACVGLLMQQDCIWDVTPPSIVTDLLVEDNVMP